jgi:hypothetical protein
MLKPLRESLMLGDFMEWQSLLCQAKQALPLQPHTVKASFEKTTFLPKRELLISEACVFFRLWRWYHRLTLSNKLITTRESNMTRLLLSAALLMAAALLAACSISASSKSSSASSESISDLASSPSSLVPTSKDKKQEGYEKDIRDYTAEYAKSADANLDAFRVKLGKIAAKYGVTQWDQDKSTYVAIGKGLRKAGLSKPQFDAFKASLGDSQPWKMQAIEEGFQ